MRRLGWLVMCCWIAGLWGCTENSSGPGRAEERVGDLRKYQVVSLRKVDIDPELGYPGLPKQLTPLIQGELARGERWVYQGPAPQMSFVVGHHMQSGQAESAPAQTVTLTSSAPADDRPAMALEVMIAEVDFPAKSAGYLKKPRTIVCQVDIFDQQSSAHLGCFRVKGRSGPDVGKQLLGTVIGGAGAVAAATPFSEEAARSAVLANTAKEIAEALEKAITKK